MRAGPRDLALLTEAVGGMLPNDTIRENIALGAGVIGENDVVEMSYFWFLAVAPVVVFVILPELLLYNIEKSSPKRSPRFPWLRSQTAPALCRISFPAALTVMGLATWIIRLFSMKGYEFRAFLQYNEPRYGVFLLISAVYYFMFGFMQYFLIDVFIAIGIFLLYKRFFGTNRSSINRSIVGLVLSITIQFIMLFLVWVRLINDINSIK